MVTVTDAIIEKLPIAIYAIDDDRFVYVNPKFADMLGYTKEEILGFGSVLDVIPAGRKEIVAEMLRRRVVGNLPEIHYITSARRRDGTLLEAEIHGSLTDVDNDRVLIGAAIEIGRHHDLARRSSDREQYFRALTEGISDVIAILDPLGRITYASLSIEQHLGGKWTDWLDRLLVTSVHATDRARFTRVLNDLLTARSFGPEQFCLRHEDGSWRDFEIAATNLLIHPQVQGFAFSLRDVTQRRKMQQSERLASLGQFAAQITHEFNNALMGINTNFEVIRRRIPANDPRAEGAVRAIDSALARSEQITADILEFGRLPRLELRPVDPGELLERALEEVRPQLPASIDLQVIETITPMIVADANRLVQVLINLFLNAKDSMQARGTLTIMTTVENGYVHFKVTDTGGGIPPEHSQSIFEPLFTTKKRGSGLGLAVVHQIVTAHGGQISFDSEVGKGSTFDVCIPVAS